MWYMGVPSTSSSSHLSPARVWSLVICSADRSTNFLQTSHVKSNSKRWEDQVFKPPSAKLCKKECKGQASFRLCSQFDRHGMTRGNIANEERYGRLFAVYRILLNHWLLNYAELQFDAGWIRMNRSCSMSLPIMRCRICAHAPAAPPSSFALLWKSFPFAIYVINIYIYTYTSICFSKTRQEYEQNYISFCRVWLYT